MTDYQITIKDAIPTVLEQLMAGTVLEEMPLTLWYALIRAEMHT